MLPAFASSPWTRVVAIASRDPRKAAEVAGQYGCRPHGYASLLADEDVEAVYVPLPAALHAEWVEAALLAGKHVLAEKPLTTELKRTVDLVDVARKRSRVLQENVLFVHHPQHDVVRKLISEGAVGEPTLFEATFTIPRRAVDDVRYKPELGGGALWDVGVYPVRAALHFFGPTLRIVEARQVDCGCGTGVDVGGSVVLRSNDRVCVRLAFGIDHPYCCEYRWYGSEGTLLVTRAFTPPPDHSPVIRMERRGMLEELVLPPSDQVLTAVEVFAKAVRAGATPQSVCIEQADILENIRACSSVMEAA
jgi:predicted dehydrogenase